MLLLLHILLVCVMLAVAAGDVVNTEILRKIDISSHITRIRTTYKASGVGEEYVFAISNGENLAFLEARIGGEIVRAEAVTGEGEELMKVKAGDGSSKDFSLTVVAVYTGLLKPFPEEIKQLDKQLVLYEDSLLAPTPYFTTSQTTTIKLASSSVESFEANAPTSIKGDTIVLGPILDSASPSAADDSEEEMLQVHYVNHAPFAKMTSCLREIEVSNWGNIAVEELYDLVHDGAKLKGGFSRLDYQVSRASSTQNPSFRSLRALLPREASGIYYRDNIGNVSTSTVELSDVGTRLELQTRYPMYGGWKTSYYMGYNIPTEVGLRHSGSHFTLEMDFGVPFGHVWVDDYTVKVVLPEGVSNVRSSMPFAVEESHTRRSTYLDTPLLGGRTVVILHMKNLVREHNVKFRVEYDMRMVYLLQEPLLLAAGFFSFFVLCIFVKRLDFSIRRKN